MLLQGMWQSHLLAALINAKRFIIFSVAIIKMPSGRFCDVRAAESMYLQQLAIDRLIAGALERWIA